MFDEKLTVILKKHNAYDSFVNNVYDSKCDGAIVLDEMDDDEEIKALTLDQAFHWGATKEGHCFWMSIDNKLNKTK